MSHRKDHKAPAATSTPAPTPKAGHKPSPTKLSAHDIERRLREEHVIAAASAPANTPAHATAPRRGQSGSVFTFAARTMFDKKKDKPVGSSKMSHITQPGGRTGNAKK